MKITSTYFLKNWQIMFFITAAIFTISRPMEPYSFSWLVKIIPVLTLILFVFLTTTDLNRKRNTLLLIGLGCSLVGDFILDYDRQGGFVFGLAAFFVAHVFYIIRLGSWKPNLKGSLLGSALLSYGGITCYLILPNLGDLLIPVIAYMVILLTMSLSAVFSKQPSRWLVLGGFSFVISDSLIGIDKFYLSINHSHIYIMISYYLAQYCLVKGLTKT